MITKVEIYRRQRNLTQRQLANKAGFHNSLLSRYEKGNFFILNDKFKRAIAKILRVPLKELFDEEFGQVYEFQSR